MADGNPLKRLIYTDKLRFNAFTPEAAEVGKKVQIAMEQIVVDLVKDGYDPSDIYNLCMREAEFAVTMQLFAKRWSEDNG